MMSYVLVALHREGDDATALTLETAFDIAKKREGASTFFGESPSLEEVESALRTLPQERRRGLVFGHCGRNSCTLRAQIESEPIWSDAPTFGAIFSEAAVYVFACETIEDPDQPEWWGVQSFGKIAVLHGVRCFVGHSVEVGVPGIPPNWNEEQVAMLRDCTEAAMLAFLNGVEDAKKLRTAIIDALDTLDEFIVSDQCPPDGEDHEAKGWGAYVLLQQLRKSLFALSMEQHGESR